ncbi:hypothetical protein DR999_PMT08651 [Platysternon megacephalum]|uniref:Uncharacterized protein n=1 Tax=Platysternon megacephalum TaxID=55544 RepID=A0A4D9ELX0_9SAUR|nr:hypothetical protein DR999_PMT08651 [Platysternon megacephalum]
MLQLPICPGQVLHNATGNDNLCVGFLPYSIETAHALSAILWVRASAAPTVAGGGQEGTDCSSLSQGQCSASPSPAVHHSLSPSLGTGCYYLPLDYARRVPFYTTPAESHASMNTHTERESQLPGEIYQTPDVF